MQVLALITARGGSKGLPGKNVKSFHGHPLIAWSIAHAQNSKLVNHVVVSTDDQEIAKAAKLYGAEVPFMRPSELSDDNAGSVDVALHAINEIEKKHGKIDVLVLLQPTSPIRKNTDIDQMLSLLKENWSTADGVITISPMKPSPLHSLTIHENEVKLNDSFKAVPRQNLPKFFASYGVCWVIKTDVLREQKTFHPKKLLPFPIVREQAVDIDDLGDFVTAEALQSLAEQNDKNFLPIFRNK